MQRASARVIGSDEIAGSLNRMHSLRDFTNARVDLGRVGDSIPTHALLEFRLAHAQARDAVHTPMDTTSLVAEFSREGWNAEVVASSAKTRQDYLLRPDLGRVLSENSRSRLAAADLKIPILYCIVDGLSATAVHHHAAAMLRELQPESPVFLAERGRVAIGDQIGELVDAEVSVLLIGERPGLSSPDSLGAYITYRPKPGRTDAERNCVSNIHEQGLTYVAAAQKILYLIHEAQTRKLSGVELKERAAVTERLSQSSTNKLIADSD